MNEVKQRRFWIGGIMAITLEKISKKSDYLYKMKLEAGESGIKNIVQWVHIIEDYDVANFLRGSELVFTTGIECDSDEWILNFTHNIFENGACGLVINIGTHIKSIPASVLQFCNQNKLPIFSVPWETKLVDITRDFCRQIVQSEQVEENIVSIFKDIIFEAKDISSYIPSLERKGFHENGNYTVIAIYNVLEGQNASVDSNLKFYVEKIANRIGDLSVTFTYDKNRLVVLSEYSIEAVNSFIDELTRQYLGGQGDFRIGISSTETGVDSIAKSFRRAYKTLALCMKKDEKVMYYDKLGIYKVLLESSDYFILNQYYTDVLKPLENYDIENNTNFMEFIKIYLDNNGSVQSVAEKMFVHRNTVNYQLNKVQKITGLDLTSLDVKLGFKLCLYIKDII